MHQWAPDLAKEDILDLAAEFLWLWPVFMEGDSVKVEGASFGACCWQVVGFAAANLGAGA